MTSPTDKAPPLCRDCVHVRTPYGERAADLFVCAASPDDGYPCLVTGELVRNLIRYALDERRELHPQACGPSGRLFKAREGV